jgi:hypothetical protein
VVDSDISRPEGSKYYNARPSQPAFQDMNFIAISKSHKARKKDAPSKDPLVVLYQTCRGMGDDYDDHPMDSMGLVMACEECGRVLPVVSDFDFFTIGNLNVKFATLSEEQLDLLDWCITGIEQVLENKMPPRMLLGRIDGCKYSSPTLQQDSTLSFRSTDSETLRRCD